MQDARKAEIHITVDGGEIEVQMSGGAGAMVIGIAAFVHDVAGKVNVHPMEVARAICDRVKELDDRMVTFERDRLTKGTEEKP